jgi:ankyrin repeat protein
VRVLVKDSGADVNQARLDGALPVFMAVQKKHLHILRCLVLEFGADINQLQVDDMYGATPVHMAAEEGFLELVRCMVEELGADVVNKTMKDGRTPLMAASRGKHKMVAKYLIKHGADPQASWRFGTAVDISKAFHAPAHLTAYLETKAHCANPGCGGAGLRKCTGCKRARYCRQQCQVAHWPTHKAECKQRT